MRVRVRIHQTEEGGFWAEVPGLPGCGTEADTLEELRHHLRDAIESWQQVAADQHGTAKLGAARLEEIEV